MKIEIIGDEEIGEGRHPKLNCTSFQRLLDEIRRASNLLDESEKEELMAFMEECYVKFNETVTALI